MDRRRVECREIASREILMELFLLGVLVGVVGAKGKRILKPIARGYLEVADRARELGAEMRENFEDALAEARYEREQEAAASEAEAREFERERPSDADPVAAGGDGAERPAAKRGAR
jgi:hypothetical protein